MNITHIEDIYPLSPMQKGMLFHSLYASESREYFQQTSWTFHGDLNISAFNRAWQQVVDRHPILRTDFEWEDLDDPVQVVYRQIKLPFEIQDWRALSPMEQQEQLSLFLQADRDRGLDLAQAPLMRFVLIQMAEDTYHFIWSHHHILLDGWSLPLILKEVLAYYESFCQGDNLHLEHPRPYRDYIAWLQNQDLSKAEAFWRPMLKGFTAPTPLGVDHAMGNSSSTKAVYDQQHIRISASTLEALQSLARKHQLTLNTLIQGTWGLLLSRYSGETDIIYGTTISGRPTDLPGAESMVGIFINTLPIRVRVPPEAPLLSWLKKLQEQQVEMRQYEYSPLVEVQGWSEVPRGTSLFESLLVFENYPVDVSSRNPDRNLKVRKVFSIEWTNYPLTIVVAPRTELLLWIKYDCRRFDATTITRMLKHLQTLLEGIVTHPEQRLSGLSILTEAERHQLLIEWNDTQKDYPHDECLHYLFEAQVERTPNAVAVVFEGEQLTYQELNDRANQLAHYLRQLGVGPDVRVGICVERSIEMVVALLGILKAGGAYVPLSPAYPEARLGFMLSDAQVPVLLTQQHLTPNLPDHRAHVICLDTDWQRIGKERNDNPDEGATSTNLAYIIYTSGSTGQPKGVMISHRAICNHMFWLNTTFPLTQADGVLQRTAFSFDASVWEFFAPLLTGARLIMAQPGKPDAADLVDTIVKKKVTILQLVPSLLGILLDEPGFETCKSLRRVFCGSEALAVDLSQRFFECLDAELYNLYGPTEASIDATSWACERESQQRICPIGRPIANTQIYLLDPHRNLVPIGIPGELYIGGVGLARGYLNRPELTEEKFIPNPFSDEPGARLYRTGDLARYLPDGNIEFLGRIDHQVKIRGFRIELGEIEATLLQHPDTDKAVVLAREDDPGDQRLVGYVVSKPESPPSVSEMRRFLSAKLPDYMVPQIFVFLDVVPLMPNGKVDRSALPSPEKIRPEFENMFVAPRTPVEELIAGIWTQVLGVGEIGIEDNFFELGGHSLLAIRVVSRLRDTFSVELPLRDLFEAPTVAGLAVQIEAAKKEKSGFLPPLIKSVDRGRKIPLSFAQQRLWFLEQLTPGSTAYNISQSTRLIGSLNVDALEKSLNEVVRRHEVLRTTFQVIDDQPCQVITEELKLKLEVIDLSEFPTSQREAVAVQRIKEKAQIPFDLTEGPLLRAMLLRLDETQHLFHFTVHHIVSDGWSMGIFRQEFATLYQAYSTGQSPSLADLSIQYADFTVWQREWLGGGVIDAQVDYWKGQLADLLTLELPTDRLRPPIQTFNGDRELMTLPKALSEQLSDLSRREGTTLYMTLLAAFKTLLYRYTGQDDIAIGSPIAGRTHAKLEGLIGFFVNTLVMRTDLSGDPSFRELLGRVREVSLGAYAHQDLPFEKLVEELRPERDLSRKPLVQVAFQLQNLPKAEIEVEGLEIDKFRIDSGTAKLDLTLTIVERLKGLECLMEYSTDLFDAATIQRMLAHFQTLLKKIVDDPDQRIETFPIFTDEEYRQIAAKRNRVTEKDPEERYDDIEDLTNLTRNQFLVWTGQQLQPETPLYNSAKTFTISGKISREHFQKAFQVLINSSDALRTVIEEIDGVPQQRVLTNFPYEIEYLDFSRHLHPQTTAKEWANRRCQMLFDLSKCLFDSVLLKIAEEQFVWYMNIYHIITDAWSTLFICQHMSDLYECSLEGRLELKDIPPFSDYVDYEKKSRNSPQYRKAKAYWKEKLDKESVPITFYGQTPQKRTASVQRVVYDLGSEKTEKLRAAALQEGIFVKTIDVSIFNILSALLIAYLHRISGVQSVSLGTPYHNRRSPEFKETIGLIMEVLLLQVAIDADDTFLSLIGKVANETYAAIQHSQYSVANPLQNPFYDVLLNYVNIPDGKFCGVPVKYERLFTGYENNSLAIEVRNFNVSDSMKLVFDFHCDVFTADQRSQAIGHFLSVLDAFLADPAQPIGRIYLLTAAEKERLLLDFNRTEIPFSDNQTVSQLFEAQVQKTPNRTALEFFGQSLTYAELNARANQLAHHLRALGVGPETLVGICAERSPEMIIGLLGILKAGGAYVPLDPTYPKERLGFMLADTQVTVLLTHRQLIERLPSHQATTVCLDADWQTIAQQPTTNPINLAKPDNLAYIIYTSGSTGKPKGVMIEHRSLMNYTEAAIAQFALSPSDRVLQFASISFDAAAEEIFSTLACGATLVLRTENMLETVDVFLQKCREWDLTVLDLPTAYWHELVATLSEGRDSLPSSVHLVVIGGEQARSDRLATWQKHVKKQVRLVNTYGPTEATIVATMCELSADETSEVPIGRPVRNVRTYVLDQYGMPVPIGVAGELHIGGLGLARGYLNRPDLTDEKFIENPFSDTPKARLYRTGDLARYLPDGNLEFIGRMDNQVKILGFRIELGEIETALASHPAVRETVVMMREDSPNDKRLVAYIIACQHPPPTVSELRLFLQEKLPEYMVPSLFVFLAILPLTSNGKVDRNALPAPDLSRPALSEAFTAPRTPVEELIAGIWTQVLGVGEIGIEDNFFDLGGHSLLAMTVIARLKKETGVQLNPATMMLQTLSQLASSYEERLENLEQQPTPTSFTQKLFRAIKHVIPGKIDKAE